MYFGCPGVRGGGGGLYSGITAALAGEIAIDEGD